MFTYIIPFRYSPDRIMNLRKVISWVRGFDFRIIVVEQDNHSKLNTLSLGVEVIFIKNEGNFNKNWALNVGLKYSKTPYVIFGDSDLIMDPNSLIASMNEIQNYDFINPYSSVIDLSPDESNYAPQDIFLINRSGRGDNDNQKVPICGGITIFNTESLYRIGGWCEMFSGWGAEDDHQSLKVKSFLKWKEMPYKCYHYNHNRFIPDMEQYNRNLSLYNKFINMSKDDLQRHINSELPKIGMINKYN